MSRVGRSIEEIMLLRSLEEPNKGRNVLTRGNDRISTGHNIFAKEKLMSSTTSSSMTKGKRRNTKQDVDQTVVNSLLEHCHTLQRRVQELEAKLILSENTVDTLRNDNLRVLRYSRSGLLTPRTPRSGGGLRPLISSAGAAYEEGRSPRRSRQGPAVTFSDAPMSSQAVTHDMDRLVLGMDKRIAELRHLFVAADPLQERHRAAAMLCAVVRGWLVRVRLRNYYNSLRAWQWGRCRHFVFLLEPRYEECAVIQAGVKSLGVKRRCRTVKVVFERWCHVYRQTAPLRRAMVVRAEDKRRAKMFQCMLNAFAAFKEGTVGNDSHKQVRRARRMMVERIRSEMHEKAKAEALRTGKPILLVSEHLLQKAVYQQIVTGFLDKTVGKRMRRVFDAFRGELYHARRNEQIAAKSKFKRFAGKCFYAWSNWVYLVGKGLERMRWKAPRNYEVRYNPKLVEHFSSARLKRLAFRPWKRWAALQKQVRRLYQIKVTAHVKNHLLAWRQIACRWANLKKDAVTSWREYPSLMMGKPFRAWTQFASSAHVRRQQQNALVDAYIRWKTRQRHVTILRTWRHQALFGGVEGMYSRTTLSKSLGEQKSMAIALEKMLARQAIELEESRDLVARETELRIGLEAKVAQRDADIERAGMKCHHLEQELRRLQSIIEAMAKVNPSQVAHIKQHQPDFQFRERNIQPSLESGRTDDLLQPDRAQSYDSAATATSTDVARAGENTTPPASSKTAEEENEKSEQPSASAKVASEASAPSAPSSAPDSTTQDVAIPSDCKVVTYDEYRLIRRVRWLVTRLIGDREMDYLERKREMLTGVTPLSLGRPVYSADGLSGGTSGELLDPEEVTFILCIMSFLRDGNCKYMNPVDARSWAREMASAALAEDASALDTGKQSAVTLGTWRQALLQLRTAYPVGEAYPEETAAGLLYSRVRDMRSELTVILAKKAERVMSGDFGMGMENAKSLYGDNASRSNTPPTLNVYADNLSKMLVDNEEEEKEEDDAFDMMDDLSKPTQQSMLLKYTRRHTEQNLIGSNASVSSSNSLQSTELSTKIFR